MSSAELLKHYGLWFLARVLRLGQFIIPFIFLIFMIKDPAYINPHDNSLVIEQWKTLFFNRTRLKGF
eukprot:UN21249